MAAHLKKSIALTDMIVGLIICLLMLTALLPAAGILDDARDKAACVHNLTLIAKALMNYSNANNGKYPRVYFDYKHPESVNAFTGSKSKDPFGPDGAKANDFTAGMFVLIRDGSLDPKTFICPATKVKTLHFGNAATDNAASPKGKLLSVYETRTVSLTHQSTQSLF